MFLYVCLRCSFFYPHPRICFSLLLGRGEERQKERERNIDMREKHQLVAFRECCGRTCSTLVQFARGHPTEVHRPGLS